MMDMKERPRINNNQLEDVYDVREKIGDGHFAEVNLCVCRHSQKKYAAKFILKQRFNSSTAIGQEQKGTAQSDIDREAFILTNLKHENIVKLHEVFHCEDSVVLILDLVTGGELFARVAECERLSEEEASNFVEQILLGVQHMHSLGVVHLDLKPENIMIEDLASRKIKIIDFGLARVLHPNETFQDMAGTPEFCAPEIVNFDPITFATDMWAIGVITYILLTGISPFAGDSQIETFQNILDCVVDYSREEIRDTTDLAKDFIRRLLVKNPKKRATVNECLQHPWIRPSDDVQQNYRRGTVIKRTNLDGLRHFIAVPTNNEVNTNKTPPVVRKVSDVADVEENFAAISVETIQPTTREVHPPAPQPTKLDEKHREKSRQHHRKHGAHRKPKRPPDDARPEAPADASPVQSREHHNSTAHDVDTDIQEPVHEESQNQLVSKNQANGVQLNTAVNGVDVKTPLPPKSSGGWRASLSHGLIGRLGAAFVAATSTHSNAPQPTPTANGPHQSNAMDHPQRNLRYSIDSPKPLVPMRTYLMSDKKEMVYSTDLSESQDSSDSGGVSSSSSVSKTHPFSTNQTNAYPTKNVVRHGLKTGNVNRAVLEFETSLLTNSTEPYISNHARTNHAISIARMSQEMERKIWDVHKVNKGLSTNQKTNQPRRQQVGRLQELFESGSVSQTSRNFISTNGQNHSLNTSSIGVGNKRA